MLMKYLPFILAMLLSSGSFWLADRAVRDLPPRFDVDGRLLRMRIEGEGSPTVVLEIGLGGALEEWAAVQPEVAAFTTVIAYDRLGANDKQPKLTGQDIARELHLALQRAGMKPPYVLVGQSFGGVYNRIFASMYPGEIAGIVLLDPSMEDFIEWMELHYPTKCIQKSDVRDWPEGAGIWDTLEQLKSLPPLPMVPIVVVTGTRPSTDPIRIATLPVWIKSHADWARKQPQSRHVLVPESGHGVHVEASRRVVDLIRETVEQVRQQDHVNQSD
jgi:pimeloyl-ACP methyl ester carboxylesterase